VRRKRGALLPLGDLLVVGPDLFCVRGRESVEIAADELLPQLRGEVPPALELPIDGDLDLGFLGTTLTPLVLAVGLILRRVLLVFAATGLA
jgi:hypothetical protein